MPYKDPEIAKKKAAERYLAKREERREKHKIYYEANKEKIIAQSKEWTEANKERVQKNQKRWKQENPEKYAESKKAAYEARKDYYIQKTVEWQKANPERHREKMRRYKNTEKGRAVHNAGRNTRRAREKHASLGRKWHKETYEIYKKCAELRLSGIDVEVDHIVPLLGKNVSGLHVPWNLAIIPAKENRTKTNKFVDAALESPK